MPESDLQHIRQLVDQLSFAEKLDLVEYLARQLQLARPADHKPEDLYGVWRGKALADLDLDEALAEIRLEWQKEWPQVFEK